jgi:sRNA-binding regulator protein Hfq
MASQLTQLARKTFALFIAFALCVLPLTAADVDAIKARFRELRADAAEVRIKLTDGAKLSGSILRLEADTFTIAQEKTGQERTFQYAQVTEVKKKGLSRGAKAILIPAVIGGSALLVLCVAPFPIGFLCRKDPS